VEIRELGRIDYREALALQHRLRAERQAGGPDVLLLLEHDPVFTRGRRERGGPEQVAGVPVVDVDRGGKMTYHGPGQLVGYPIVKIDDVVGFVRAMERAIIQALARHGIEGRSRGDEGHEFIGVWVEDRKIASIGVHVQKGVTTHGFAVNVCGDLQPWEWITPCGLPGVRMTSILEETGRADPDAFRADMAEAWMQLLSKA
jgi:lipoyl(octanoyl) transferase